MKIAVIGSSEIFESICLEEEGKKLGHEMICLEFDDAILETGSEIKFVYKDEDFKSFDAIIFRGITKHIPQAQLLADYVYSARKIVVDEKLATQRYIESKFSSMMKFAKAGLPVPRTFQIFDFKNLKKITDILGFPLICKKQMAAKGEGVFKAEDLGDLQKLLENEDLGTYIFQEYIPSNFDVRVLVVGQKVLGGMKRTARKGEFRSNVAQGGKVEKFSLNSELAKLAQKTSQVSGNDVSGVDIMIDDHAQPYVIECNRAPQFKAFQRITGVNCAQEIIQFIEQKLEKKSK